jgi:predicted hotdog family 3-hydroxylacyl-ACP dehydratase
MLILKKDIEKYIPQRAPMVMVDGLLESGSQVAVSVFRPEDDNLFCEDGYFTEPGILENIAQTAALHAGYQALQAASTVKTGFIGGVKHFRLHQLPPATSDLRTRIEIVHEFWNVTMVKGEVFAAGNLIAAAELSIFTPEEEAG